MKKIIFTLLTGSAICLAAVASEPDNNQDKPCSSNNVSKISEAFGHLIGKNLESMGVKFDMAKVIQGLKDASDGKESPMNEADCIDAITKAQEIAFHQISKENLEKAESFLEKNQTISGVHQLEDNKLQFVITKEGQGEEVQENSTPLIRYIGKFMDGSVFGASQEEEPVRLDETITGFTKGLIGMKEGEKRTLFIHPDLGYGTQGALPPNTLLTFEIEVVKANTPLVEEPHPLSPMFQSNPEIATPFEDLKAIR